MEEGSDSYDQKDRQRPSAILFSAASAYFIAVSALYLWGVNIMEYLDLADMVKAAAWPVGSVFFFAFVGMVLGQISPVSRLPEGGGQHTRVGRWFNNPVQVLAAVFAVVVVALILFAPPRTWPLIALLTGAILSFPLRSYPPVVRLIPNNSIRSVLSFAVVVLPLFAYTEGRVNADSVRSGKKYLYVQLGSEGVPSTGDPKSSMRYVGYAGSTFFLWDPVTLSLTLVPSGTVKSLKLANMPLEK